MTNIPDGFIIRMATAHDAEMLRDLGSRIFVDTFAEANTQENMESYLATAFSLPQVRREIDDASSKVLISEIKGGPIGYARLHAGPSPAEIVAQRPLELARLYIDHTQHGTGVAAMMMQRCVDVAREGDHDVLWLGVWEHNPRAQAFYRKWQFEKVGAQSFWLGDDEQTDWLMSRAI